MPESKGRKKKSATYTPPPTVAAKNRPPSPPWVGASILVLFAIGVVWLTLYYTTGGGIVGQRALGGWNVFVGFGFIVAGFGVATQWR